jgi:hypothetical protein
MLILMKKKKNGVFCIFACQTIFFGVEFKRKMKSIWGGKSSGEEQVIQESTNGSS